MPSFLSVSRPFLSHQRPHLMTRLYVNQLANGESVDELYLVSDKQLRANRQGNLYLHLELRDKTGVVGARLWNVSEDLAATFEPGDYLREIGRASCRERVYGRV